MATKNTPANTDKKTVDQFLARMSKQVGQVQDPEAATMQILAEIADATDIDAVLAPSKLASTVDMVGTPFTVQDIKFNQSGFEAGLDVYGVVTAKLPNGDVTRFASGSAKVCFQIVKMMEMGSTDVVVEIEHFTTGGGYDGYGLIRAAESF